jgi:outer membrane lipoprotein-sorting protein
MKKIFVSALMIASTMLTYAQDITVDELLDNYFENIGGRDAWGELEGHKMSAEVEAQGMTIPVEVYMMKDGKTLTKFQVQGMEMVQGAFDGEVSWSTNFMSMKAEKADAEETENAKRNSKDYPDPFFNYEEKGYSVEMDGTDNVDGVECFKVKLTKTPVLVDGEEQENIVTYYFDQESYVPVMAEQEVFSGPAKGQTAITEFSDYQEVEGLYFPFSITYRSEDGNGQTIEFDEVEINPEVEEDFFSFPGEE